MPMLRRSLLVLAPHRKSQYMTYFTQPAPRASRTPELRPARCRHRSLPKKKISNPSHRLGPFMPDPRGKSWKSGMSSFLLAALISEHSSPRPPPSLFLPVSTPPSLMEQKLRSAPPPSPPSCRSHLTGLSCCAMPAEEQMGGWGLGMAGAKKSTPVCGSLP